jgi:hypothetical protein
VSSLGVPRPRPQGARLALAALAGSALVGGPSVARAQFGLVTLPLNDPAYVQLAALERAGCAPARVSVVRPYEIRLIRAALIAARAQRGCAGQILDVLATRFAPTAADAAKGLRIGAAATAQATALHNGTFLPLWENVRPTSQGDPPAVGLLHGRLTWGDSDRVAIVGDGYAETSVRNDPTVRARRFRQTSGIVDFSEAYATARAGVFTFTLGRGEEAWLGSGIESMVLSANGPPIDRIAAEFHTAHFEGRAMFGTLDDVVMDSAHDSLSTTIGPQRYYRYIAGHELTWRPSRIAEITVGETALLSRGAQTVDLAYVNPFIPFQITQHDSGQTGDDALDNLTTFAAIRLRAGRVTGAAELLIDDIQIDANSRRKTPDQLGYDLTLSTPLPVPLSSTLSLEYERMDSYTYMRAFYTEVYQHYDQPLGSQLGPDADYGRVGADVFPRPWLRVAAGLGFWRRGLQRIYERPAQMATGHANAPFPTSTPGRPVQEAALGDASIQFLNPVLPITASVQVARVRDANNLPVPTTNYAQLQLTATYALHYP